MEGVKPQLIRVFNRGLQISHIDFGVPQYGGLRTAQDQAALFADGKSKADGVKKLSKHQNGNALDFYAYVDGKASWQEEHLTHVAAAILQAAAELGVPVEWGGFWESFRDMPHIQLA
jgi:peptidoglycan L-alanyl-D-glutamate endopeptidase CwlK